MSLLINGRLVCCDAFLVYYGISQYKYYAALKHIRNENFLVVHGNSLRDYKNTLHDLCYAYLQKLMDHLGDKQPDCDEVHLPCYCLKSEIYEEFLNSIKSTILEEDFPSYRTFTITWQKEFSMLKIPKKINWVLVMYVPSYRMKKIHSHVFLMHHGKEKENYISKMYLMKDKKIIEELFSLRPILPW